MPNIIEERDQLEEQIRAIINAEEAPVLGPGLETIRIRHQRIMTSPGLDRVRQALTGSPDAFGQLVRGLQTWPAIFVLLLTDAVAHAYSPENEYAVYLPILKMLGRGDSFTPREQTKLREEFQTACQRLGLSVTTRTGGVGYIVDEFLHQVGLPLCFVERVTALMAETTEAIGRPDEDDPSAIRQWQEDLLNRAAAQNLPKHARLPLEADVTGYYARLFLRVAETGHADTGSIAGRMAAALNAGGKDLRKRGGALRIPRLLWRNGELVLQLPPGEAEKWTIQVDDDVPYQYQGETGARIVPVPALLPHCVEVRASRGASCRFALWPDSLDNRLLIFDEEGRWRAAAQLNAAPVKLAPGRYTLLLRFAPQGHRDEVECLQTEPSLYLLPVELRPGKSIDLRRGPAILALQAEPRPWLGFEGRSLTSADGRRIFFAPGLQLHTAGLDGQDQSGTPYEVRFTGADQELGVVPAAGCIDLTGVVDGLEPALYRIVAELRPRGTQRAVARTAILLWQGLAERDAAGRLVCRAWPNNLNTAGCENAVPEPDRQRIALRDVRAGRPVSLPLSSLSSELDGGQGSLAFFGPQGRIELAQLTAPHEVRAFDLQRTPRDYRLRLAFAAPCSQLRVHAENLLTGEELSETVLCDDPDGWNEQRWLRLESQTAEEGWAGCLTFQIANWPKRSSRQRSRHSVRAAWPRSCAPA